NAAISWPLEREAKVDEWYVDALAVFTDWGSQGIGMRRLARCRKAGTAPWLFKDRPQRRPGERVGFGPLSSLALCGHGTDPPQSPAPCAAGQTTGQRIDRDT